MSVEDHGFYMRRVAEELELVACLADPAREVHRIMAEEYQRRIDVLDCARNARVSSA